MLIDAHVPCFHVSGAADLPVQAPAARVYHSALELTFGELASTRRILSIATLIARLRRGGSFLPGEASPSRDEPVIGLLERAGWSRLAAIEPRELVMGMGIRGDGRATGSAVACSIHVDAGPCATRLAVEFRVLHASSDRTCRRPPMRDMMSKHAFMAIAREWLHAVRRRAEMGAPVGPAGVTRGRGGA